MRDAGPSRTAVVIGMCPLLSVAVALLALGEPFRPLLGLGAVLITVGGWRPCSTARTRTASG
ncbi:MAG: hypothetical protein ACRDK8_09625, partial [Solirubrobacteraceae bacterium]